MTIRLAEALPQFAEELKRLLSIQGRDALAEQIASANIVQRCTCRNDFCASFYLAPKPNGAYPPGFETIDLDAEEGMLLVDVVSGKIARVEVLNRDDVRQKINNLFPR